MLQRPGDDASVKRVELESLVEMWRRYSVIPFDPVPPGEHVPGKGIVWFEFDCSIYESLASRAVSRVFLFGDEVAGLGQ